MFSDILKELTMERHQSAGFKNKRCMVTLFALAVLTVIPSLAFAGSSCDYCHGMPPQDSADGSRDPLTGAFKGSHAKHVSGTVVAANCVKCHGAAVKNYSSAHAATGNYLIKMASPVNGYTGAVYGTKGTSFPQSESPVTETCSNVNCHFKAPIAAWGEAPASALDCSSCHTTPRGMSGSHSAHETYYNGTSACIKCHPNNTTFQHATSASHRGVAFTTGINYSGAGKNALEGTAFGECSNIYCHSDGTRAVSFGNFTSKKGIDPVWGGQPLLCNGCHGSSVNGSKISTGTHTQHITSTSFTFSCQTCHNATVDADMAIKDKALHTNTNIDVSLANGGTYSANGHAAGGAAGDCTTICHSSGKIGVSGVPGYTSVTWGSTANKGCATCHGTSTTTGAPDYPEHVGEGTAQANSHTRHVAGKGIGCQVCHIQTTSNGTTIDGSMHLNNTINVNFGTYNGIPQSSASYNSSDKTCSTTVCHGAGPSVKWGGTIPAGSCNSCHGDAAAPATLSGKHTAHLAATPDNGGQFTCTACHASTASNNTTVSNEANHANGMVNYSGVYAPKAALNGGNCTTYCHSDGKGNYVSPGSWTGAITLGCDGCHGTATGGTPQTGNHAVHLAKVGIDCTNCHNSTTNVVGKITTIANHINKTAAPAPGGSYSSTAVSFDFNANTCSNISCHGGSGSSAVAWGAASLNCAGCHATLSAGHTRHVGSLLSSVTFYNYTANTSTGAEGASKPNYGFGCANCHPLTIASHNNGTIDVSLAPVAGNSTLRSRNTVAAAYSAGSCQNVYCHSDGKGLMATTPTWGGTFANADRCQNCHGNAPTTGAHQAHAVGIHYNNIFTGTSDLLAPGSTGNVSHGVAAQATTITCKTCHADTTTSARNKNASTCTSCHGGDAATTIAKIDGSNGLALHVNGAANISFDTTPIRSKAQIRPVSFSVYSGLWTRNVSQDNYKTGETSYDIAKTPLNNSMWVSGTSSCSNIVCHNLRGGASVSWTAGPLTCESCHSKL